MSLSPLQAAGWFMLTAALLVPPAVFAAPAVSEKAPAAKAYWVYIGTYTGKDDSKGIYRFDLDPATGKLTNKALAAESASPSYLAFHPDGRFLYSVNEVPGQKSGAVSAPSPWTPGPVISPTWTRPRRSAPAPAI